MSACNMSAALLNHVDGERQSRRSSLVGKMPSTYLTAPPSLPLSFESVIVAAFSRSSVIHTQAAACFWGVSRRKSLFDGEIRTVALPPALSS